MNIQTSYLQRYGLREVHVKQSHSPCGRDLILGDVALVRSSNLPTFGDHLIVVTGGLVQKPHGLRPETLTITIPDNYAPLLDNYVPTFGVTLLILLPSVADHFRHILGITFDGKTVTVP